MDRDTLALEAMAGTVLEDKYKLVRILGSGAMAHVYEAEQLRLGRSVAVKIMRVALASDRRSLDRFRTEALAASRINHPNAIAIYDVGVTRDGIPFLVMEHLRGVTLATARAASKFPIERIVNIGAQVLSALEEAHGCGVIHRDLKSENVVLEPRRDGTDFVKVLDFGIAAFVGSADQSVVGTPEYMAPEQIRGLPPVAASDIYAVGVMLYEMVVGHTPFAGALLSELLDMHLSQTPRPPHELVPCPEQLSHVIMRALEKDPVERWSDAGEMREELLQVIAGTGRACRTCGSRVQPGVRYCSSCGSDLDPPQGAATPLVVPRNTLAFGSGPPTATKERPRATRLTFDLSVDTGTMVGRDDEAAFLADWLGQPAGSDPLAVVGVVGVGKARLVLEAARHSADTMVTFVAAPDPSGHQQSWYPILSMLEAILGLPTRPSYEDLVASLSRVSLPSRDAPGLAELFSVPGPLATLELAVRRRETFAAAIRTLLSVEHLYRSPILCFIDVDRYDHPSRRLLEQLVSATVGTGVRLILTASSADAVPDGTELMPVAGLDPEEAHTFLGRVIGPERAESVTPALLHELTGGVPAHVQQLAGWLVLQSDVATAPARMVDLVSSRLGHLSASARRLLQAVAAHGQVAPRADLGTMVAEIDPTGAALTSLVRAGLVIAGQEEITIPLALVAQVATACTPAETRRELAHHILSTIGRRLPVVIEAHHAEAADELERALGAFVTAGDDAVRRFDDRRAAALYHKAVTIARRMQANGDPTSANRMVAISLRLADVLRYMGELALASGCLDEAELAAADLEQQAGILRARGRIAMMAGHASQAVTVLRKAIGMAYRNGDIEFLSDSYLDLASALTTDGGIADAIVELTEAVDTLTLGEGLAHAEKPARLWLLGLRLALLHQRAGNLPAARRMAREALTHAERTGSSVGQGRLHAVLGTLLEQSGEPQTALQHQARAIDHMRKLGDRRTTAELLLACARITGEHTPVTIMPGRRGVEPVDPMATRKAEELAAELAAEIGWDGKTSSAS